MLDEARLGYYLMIILIPIETANQVAVGALRGLGKIHWLPLVQFIGFYILEQPFSYIMIKVLGFGYWIYLAAGIGVSVGLAVWNYLHLWRIDWQ